MQITLPLVRIALAELHHSDCHVWDYVNFCDVYKLFEQEGDKQSVLRIFWNKIIPWLLWVNGQAGTFTGQTVTFVDLLEADRSGGGGGRGGGVLTKVDLLEIVVVEWTCVQLCFLTNSECKVSVAGVWQCLNIISSQPVFDWTQSFPWCRHPERESGAIWS